MNEPPMKPQLIKFPLPLLAAIKAAAAADHKGISAWVRDACLQQLRKRIVNAADQTADPAVRLILAGLNSVDHIEGENK